MNVLKKNLENFKASSDFAVQWQQNGSLLVIYAPMMEDKNPFFFKTKNGYIDTISAADKVTDEFLKNVGKHYYEQYTKISKNEKIVFPPVKFNVSTNCFVDTKNKIIVRGTAVAQGVVKGLDGKIKPFKIKIELKKLWATVYHVDAKHNPKSICFDGYEIQGHPDPNCAWRWFECKCIDHPCCTHIVQPLFGNPQNLCYDEKCAWGWLWLGCGCHKNNVVPCPDCTKTRMKNWKSQLKKANIKLSQIKNRT